jgi:sn-glycerol 3-phosphate transport system substrate-binding protein
MKLLGLSSAVAVATLLTTTSAFAVTEISWWHAMTGANNEVVETFPRIQREPERLQDYACLQGHLSGNVERRYRGVPSQAATDDHAGVRCEHRYDDGRRGAIKPVAEHPVDGRQAVRQSQYLPGIVSYCSKPDGTMLSFPYNSSSPILYYNKDIFKKAGLDENNPPKTWNEVWDAAKKIKSSGAAPCGFTSTWLTWIHTENFAAWNNYQWGTQENGIAGPNVELKINAKPFVDHFQALADLAGRHVQIWRPHLRGQADLPRRRVRAVHRILGRPRRHHQVGHELRHRHVAFGRRDAEHDPGRRVALGFCRQVGREYKGVAAFFQFPVADRHSGRLHQVSGYLPVTLAAYEKSKAPTGSTKRTRRARSDQADAGRAYRELQGRSPA